MILSKKILILEDDLLTVSKILNKLVKLEQDQEFDFCLVVLSDYIQVQDYINNNPKAEFDIILLDRDCKLGGSFHVLDIERFGPEKIIAISTVPEYNEQAKQRGVKRVVLKDYQHLDEFADKVVNEIEQLIDGKRLNRLTKIFN